MLLVYQVNQVDLHIFLLLPLFLSLGLAILCWARVADNGRIMRQGGLLTVAQHSLKSVTSCRLCLALPVNESVLSCGYMYECLNLQTLNPGLN